MTPPADQQMAISAERQTPLPFRKLVRIAWKNIRVRLLRSMLVNCGIILALAFLMYVTYSDALQRYALESTSAEFLDTLKARGISIDRDDADTRIQMRWMVGLALLISFVGILNAMVLNVTERFREIGTIKCLGALDSLVIKLYLIESAFQGLVGTTVGIALGGCLAFGEGFRLYGGSTFSLVPGKTAVTIVGLCALSGIVLSIGGALYPAWLAARMQPVEAMRREV